MRALLLLFLLMPTGFASELKGDWESAGSPITLYEPSYPFEYNCQLEMKILERAEIAVVSFLLDGKNTFWAAGKDTKWEFLELRSYEFSRILRKLPQPKDSFLPLQGVRAQLSFQKKDKSDSIVISLYTDWKVNGVTFSSQPAKKEGDREQSQIKLDVNQRVKWKEKTHELSQQLICIKKL